MAKRYAGLQKLCDDYDLDYEVWVAPYEAACLNSDEVFDDPQGAYHRMLAAAEEMDLG
jgi:hypothetical protein